MSSIAISEYELPGPVTPIPVVALSDAQLLSSTRGVLMGWSLRNGDAAVTAVAHLHDSTDETGMIIAEMGIASSLSDTEWFGPIGVPFNTALRLAVIAGTLYGAVYVSLERS